MTPAGQNLTDSSNLDEFGRGEPIDPAAVPRQLKIELRYSQNGIPSFITSPLPERITRKGIPEDFLWIPAPPGQHRDWRRWWQAFEISARRERACWEKVQQAMATDLCHVEITSKPGRQWVQVPPDERFQPRKSTPTTAPDSGSGDTKPGSGGKPLYGQKTTRGKSGLRNEVQQD